MSDLSNPHDLANELGRFVIQKITDIRSKLSSSNAQSVQAKETYVQVPSFGKCSLLTEQDVRISY